jgi:hypothetical protein
MVVNHYGCKTLQLGPANIHVLYITLEMSEKNL